MESKGWAASIRSRRCARFQLQRRDPGERDVLIEILFCGICHSDLHQGAQRVGGHTYPLVPGTKIVGRVAKTGAAVGKVKAGDIVGVRLLRRLVRPVRSLPARPGELLRARSRRHVQFRRRARRPDVRGLLDRIVVDEKFVLRVKAKERLDAVAPLLCAGITTWSPLRHWKVGKGHRVAVLGLGGLGHMAVKLASALGAEVTLLSSSPSKKQDAQRLGAHEFVLTAEARKLGPRFDFILDSVSAPHDLNALAGTLRLDGTLIMLGASPQPMPLHPFALIMKRRSLAGSLVGGIPETQEVLDFCADKKISADVETIPAKDIDRAYDRMLKGDVRYRFSIDLSTL